MGADNATAREKKALAVLSEEIEKRSQVRPPVQTVKASRPGEFAIYAAPASQHGPWAAARICDLGRLFALRLRATPLVPGKTRSGRWLSIIGADERGLLFGVGKVLRVRLRTARPQAWLSSM